MKLTRSRSCSSVYRKQMAPVTEEPAYTYQSVDIGQLCKQLKHFKLKPSRLSQLIQELPSDRSPEIATTAVQASGDDDWDLHLSQLGRREGHLMEKQTSQPPSPSILVQPSPLSPSSPIQPLLTPIAPLPANYTKWHIIKLRNKLDFLGKNDRGTREELIQRLNEYYLSLREIIHDNPWVREEFEYLMKGDSEEEELYEEYHEEDDGSAESRARGSEQYEDGNDDNKELLHSLLDIIDQMATRLINVEAALSTKRNVIPPPTSNPIQATYNPHKQTHASIPPPSSYTNEWKLAKSSTHKKPTEQKVKLTNRYSTLAVDNSVVNADPTPESESVVEPKTPGKNNKRCQIFINQRPENQHTWQQSTALFSDSICNRMSKNILKKQLGSAINKKAFPGATAVDMYRHYMIPTLENNTPDNAIIHCGINDLLSMEDQLTDETAANVAERIIRCGLVCKEYGVSQIAISTVLHKSGTHLQATTNQINNKLYTWCRKHSFNFINNINIPFTNPYDPNTLFYNDGLHLNDAGRDALLHNFKDYQSML